MPRTIYAILIGINDYPVRPLGGCINDVLAISSFFSKMAQPNPISSSDLVDLAFNPLYLLAPLLDEDTKAVQEAGLDIKTLKRPTRNNIIEAFKHFEQAQSENGDICLLYYSGHGSYQKAPPQLRFDKDLPQVETLVCLADEAGTEATEIVDKELGYLIYESTKGKIHTEGGKGIHFLTIMDCCYSGDNTRGSTTTQRRYNPMGTTTPIEAYIGFDRQKALNALPDYFYQLSNDGKTLKTLEVPHQSLAATQDNELANERYIEGVRRGIFTTILLKTLQSNGIFNTYHDIMSRVAIQLQQMVSDQNPTITKRQPDSERTAQTLFLGGGFKPPILDYPVFYRPTEDKWFVKVGTIDGIYPSSPQTGDTTIQLLGSNVMAKLLNIRSTESEIDPSVIDRQKAVFYQNKDPNLGLSAVVVKMAASKIKVFLPSELENELKNPLASKLFIDLVKEENEAQFVIQKRNNHFLATAIDKTTPLFKRTADAQEFSQNLNKVGKWYSLMQLDNAPILLNTHDVEVTVEVIEGKPISFNTLNDKNPIATRTLANPKSIAVEYKEVENKQVQPVIRVHIAAKTNSCYIGSLYLTSLYGSICNLNPQNISPNGNGVWLTKTYEKTMSNTIVPEKKTSTTITLSFTPLYHDWGITEIQDYLKIFVSNKPFDLKNHQQEGLSLDDNVNNKGIVQEDYQSFQDWYCLTIPIRINRPIRDATLKNTTPLNIGGAKLTAPLGFSATVRAKSISEIRRMVEKDTEKQNSDALKAFTPPLGLSNMNGNTTEIFAKALDNVPTDGHLSSFELSNIQDGQFSSANPLIFTPKDDLEEGETLVAFGYDPEHKIFMPLGFSDEKGAVRIEKLPPQYQGSLFVIEEEELKKGFLKSVGLMFLRVVTKPFTTRTFNELSISSLDIATKAMTLPVSLKKGERPLAEDTVKNIVLLIHGIIGDTENQVAAFQNYVSLRQSFDTVLTFNYENLNTPIEETAKDLQKQLYEAGLFDQQQARLTIVAHSMGGLVSRYFIEQLLGKHVVKHLIQLGTPNGGTPISEFRKWLGELFMLGINQVESINPYLPIIKFLLKHTGRAVFATLNQMDPKSKFILDLNKTANAPIPYHIIAGSTHLEMSKEDKESQLYKTLNWLIFNNVIENDIAVTQGSMATLPNFNQTQLFRVPCNHLAYFNNDETCTILESLL